MRLVAIKGRVCYDVRGRTWGNAFELGIRLGFACRLSHGSLAPQAKVHLPSSVDFVRSLHYLSTTQSRKQSD